MTHLPKAFDPAGELNPKVARFKLVRVGKWSLKSKQSLWDIVDLATYLLALDRNREAADIGDFISAEVVFGGGLQPLGSCLTIDSRWSPRCQNTGGCRTDAPDLSPHRRTSAIRT